jgi:hypothetical protein
MTKNELLKYIQNIVLKAYELKNKYTSELNVSVDYACIFCQNDGEYVEYCNLVNDI